MRLIDADALRESMDSYYDRFVDNCIKKAPTVDAVEVVRCKDCTYWDKISGGFAFWIGRCTRRGSVTGCDYFCGSAEREEDLVALANAGEDLPKDVFENCQITIEHRLCDGRTLESETDVRLEPKMLARIDFNGNPAVNNRDIIENLSRDIASYQRFCYEKKNPEERSHRIQKG